MTLTRFIKFNTTPILEFKDLKLPQVKLNTKKSLRRHLAPTRRVIETHIYQIKKKSMDRNFGYKNCNPLFHTQVVKMTLVLRRFLVTRLYWKFDFNSIRRIFFFEKIFFSAYSSWSLIFFCSICEKLFRPFENTWLIAFRAESQKWLKCPIWP